MFPNLGSSVVEMVLSEYKEVEIVMDYLLELSTPVKENYQESTGFATVASLLDDFEIESQGPEISEEVPDEIETQDTCVDETVCNDLDTLLDEALDRYGLNVAESFPNAEQCEGTSLLDQTSAIHISSFPTDYTTSIDQSEADVQREGCTCALDSDVTTIDDNAVTSLHELEYVESECNSAPDMMVSSLNNSVDSQENVGSDGKPSEVDLQCTGPSYIKPPNASPNFQMKWNPMASSFYPKSNVNPPFIAPVAFNPTQWTCVAGSRAPVSGVCYNPPPFVWNFNHFPQNHLKNTENITPINMNKSQMGAQISKKGTQFAGKVLVLLRGAPGSGKSTLARLLLEQNPTGVILSTDDYFHQNGQYQYDISCLGEAHEWNHKRAKDAFEKNVSPIIIDNTNLQGWEMKPYVSMAMKNKYKVTFREPDTWWKYKPKELERRNRHGVKKEKIIKMLEHFERVTVNSILNLSHPKASESAGGSQRKTDNKHGEPNVLPMSLKEEKKSLSETPESDNTADMDIAVPAMQKSLEVSEDGPEFFPDVPNSKIKNLTTPEGDNDMDFIQLVQNINIDNEAQCDDDCSADDTAVDEHSPDIDNRSSLLNEKPEFLDFVGDWPVVQTISQRAPRSRKPRVRHEKNNPSVQKCVENDRPPEHIDKAIEQEPIDIRSSEQDHLKEAASLNMEHHIDSSTVNYEEQLLELENEFCNSLTSHNEENYAKEEEGQSQGMFIDKLSDVQEQVAECTDGEDIQSTILNEDVKIKPRPQRRSCRHCKLAVNFPNSCAISSKQEESECFPQPSGDLCKYSQTEPQDFALAWRIERRNEEVLDSAKIRIGKGSRFTSKPLHDSSDAQENIPYRVMHHKSTFVEEDDIISLGDQDSLDILCKLFRSLSFDILKDLFERCNKDIIWTTNLLLDNGEKIYKDEECESVECDDLESCSHSDMDNLQEDSSVITEQESVIISEEHCENVEADFISHSSDTSEYSPLDNTLPFVVAEELRNVNVLSSNEMNLGHQCTIPSEPKELFPNCDIISDTIASDLMWPSDLETADAKTQDSTLNILQSSDTLKTMKKDNTEELHLNRANFSKISEIHSPEMLVVDYNEEEDFTEVTAVVEEEKKMQNKSNSKSQSRESLHFDYLELTLPPEFAFQLTELFGPVGVDPGSLTIEDCVVPIDLKLAESIHKKWKESIVERHRQEALSYQLMLDSVPEADPCDLDKVLQNQESGVSQKDTDLFPFMDQWNTKIKKVSMRQIIAEEMALQAHEDSKKSSASKNCAVKLKEKQLLELFPHMEQQLLLDIFKENNYSLEKTEQFMSSVLEADPVQNVIAQGFKQAVPTATEKNKEKKLKPDKEILNERYFQDLDYPNYDDFRAEALLYHHKQQESYRKAAEAHTRGMQQVAAYYAQQGYLYGQKMKQENRRAAVQIFERANEYLLPENILDLHGLHVDEAMKHFRKVLQDKIDEFKQNGGKPHLLVITGRGNHSQGGVPRIKPAVIDFLTNHDYRFQEKTPGVLRVTLK